MLTFKCNQWAEVIGGGNQGHLSLVATVTILSYSFLKFFTYVQLGTQLQNLNFFENANAENKKTSRN